MALRIRRPAAGPARGRGGFTLLEVLIALTVLAFGMLGLAAMQLYAMGAGREGRNTTQASVIAQDQLEQFMSATWGGMTDTAGAWSTAQTVNVDMDTGGGSQTQQAYQLRWRITDSVANWTKNVDVEVSWTEPKRGSQTLVMSTTRYRR